MESAPTSINLETKLAKFSDRWHPKIVSNFNGHDVMLVKLKGEFVWHSHPDTDDFFLVLKGILRIDLRTPSGESTHVELNPGELYMATPQRHRTPPHSHRRGPSSSSSNPSARPIPGTHSPP